MTVRELKKKVKSVGRETAKLRALLKKAERKEARAKAKRRKSRKGGKRKQ